MSPTAVEACRLTADQIVEEASTSQWSLHAVVDLLDRIVFA
jgi:hypothetical protein